MKNANPKKTDKKRQNSKNRKRTAFSAYQQIPKERIWLFKFITIVLVPLIFFILLELVLRIAGAGYPTSAIIQRKVEGEKYIHDNPKYGYRYFSRKLAREFTPFMIPLEKPRDSYRIFILGGSAAQGTPEAAYSFSRMLNVMLKYQYPAVNFEVVNLAMPAINSHVVLDITNDCLDYEPDALICYMGNNEVVGPFGAGSVFSSFTASRSLIRFINAVKRLRIVQVLTVTLEKAGLKKDTVSHWKGMAMFLEKQVRADDPALNQVYAHFKDNLQKMSALAAKKDVDLFICSVGSNLKDSPPFSSLHSPGLSDDEISEWNLLYNKGVVFEEAGDINEAIQTYLAAAKIDSAFADLQFRLGHCYRQQGDFSKALDHYKMALWFDTNRFRSDTRINEIIRNVATSTISGSYFIDVWDKFRENSPHGIPGEELFLEHVHLNFRGNYLLAKTVFEEFNTHLPERIRQHADPNFVLSDSLIAHHLVFTELANYQIYESVINDYMMKPPFTNQLYHLERITKMQAAQEEVKKKINPEMFGRIDSNYRNAIRSNPADWMLHWKYAGLLASSDLMNDKEAVKHYRYVSNSLPHYPNAYVLLGLVMGRLGHLNESVSLNKQALQMDPAMAEAYFNIGLVSQIQEKPEQALEYYYKTLVYKPDHPRAYNNISVIYYNQGDYSNSIEILRKGLSYLPDDPELHYKLAYMLKLSGQVNEAVLMLKKALKIDPDNLKVQGALNSLLQNK